MPPVITRRRAIRWLPSAGETFALRARVAVHALSSLRHVDSKIWKRLSRLSRTGPGSRCKLGQRTCGDGSAHAQAFYRLPELAVRSRGWETLCRQERSNGLVRQARHSSDVLTRSNYRLAP